MATSMAGSHTKTKKQLRTSERASTRLDHHDGRRLFPRTAVPFLLLFEKKKKRKRISVTSGPKRRDCKCGISHSPKLPPPVLFRRDGVFRASHRPWAPLGVLCCPQGLKREAKQIDQNTRAKKEIPPAFSEFPAAGWWCHEWSADSFSLAWAVTSWCFCFFSFSSSLTRYVRTLNSPFAESCCRPPASISVKPCHYSDSKHCGKPQRHAAHTLLPFFWGGGGISGLATSHHIAFWGGGNDISRRHTPESGF